MAKAILENVGLKDLVSEIWSRPPPSERWPFASKHSRGWWRRGHADAGWLCREHGLAALQAKGLTYDEPLDEISFVSRNQVGFQIAVGSWVTIRNGPLRPGLRHLRGRTTKAMVDAHSRRRSSAQIPTARNLITRSSSLHAQTGAAGHQRKNQAMIWDAGSEFGMPGSTLQAQWIASALQSQLLPVG